MILVVVLDVGYEQEKRIPPFWTLGQYAIREWLLRITPQLGWDSEMEASYASNALDTPVTTGRQLRLGGASFGPRGLRG